MLMTSRRRDAVTFAISLAPEDDGPEGYFASGDDEQDAETCADIREQVEQGNDWAWCLVCVRATFGEFAGVAYLSACSYASEEDFKQGGYYEQMQEEALEDMTNNMDAARDTITEWGGLAND